MTCYVSPIKDEKETEGIEAPLDAAIFLLTRCTKLYTTRNDNQ